MNKLKILLLVSVLFNLIFADETKSDSLYWNTNPLKRQRLFYSVENNPNFPSDDCVGLGCCLIPLTGGLIIGQRIFAKDTTKKDTAQVNKSKWGFGIGYSGRMCYTGEDLMKYLGGEMIFEHSPIELILARLYWLNSFEGSIYYSMSKKWGIEGGGGWWWARISPSEYDNWEFNLFPVFSGIYSSKFALKIKYIFLYAKDQGKTTGSTKKEGKGKGYVFSSEYYINKNARLVFSLGWGNYIAKEYFPDHISEYIVDIYFNGIGFSVGYKFNL